MVQADAAGAGFEMAEAGGVAGIATAPEHTAPSRAELGKLAHDLGIRVGWDGDAALVNPVDAATLAGVSRRTIYNWIASGLIETRLSPRGTQRIVVQSLWREGKESK